MKSVTVIWSIAGLKRVSFPPVWQMLERKRLRKNVWEGSVHCCGLTLGSRKITSSAVRLTTPSSQGAGERAGAAGPLLLHPTAVGEALWGGSVRVSPSHPLVFSGSAPEKEERALLMTLSAQSRYVCGWRSQETSILGLILEEVLHRWRKSRTEVHVRCASRGVKYLVDMHTAPWSPAVPTSASATP